jgi:TDG/mug DNA glycosylase family protein
MFLTGLAPIVSHNPKILILGSMPGARSLELQQYYANPGNCFWFIMGELCGAKPGLPYAERTTRLTQAGIALWDVLKRCERIGSLDSQILSDTEIPNDLVGFLQDHQTIELICFNGQKAAKSFAKLVEPTLSGELLGIITLVTLPSTSPANTSETTIEKTELWMQALRPYLPLYKA